MTPRPEQILCSRTAELPVAWLPECGAIAIREPTLFDSLADLEPAWLPRPAAETDPTHKQWIPYVLLAGPGEQLAVYPRRGTEARLHGLWSCGIGGHINPIDQPPASSTMIRRAFWRETLLNGLQRELREEFPAAADGTTTFLGLIHESRTAVGKVHLGAVFLHQIHHIPTEPGPELAGLQWIHRQDLGQDPWPLDRFELWSRLAFDLLSAVSNS